MEDKIKNTLMSLFRRSPSSRRRRTTSASPVDLAFRNVDIHTTLNGTSHVPRRRHTQSSSYTTSTYASRPSHRHGLPGQRRFRVI